jgi:uncharacterized protein YabE (DUF348 family)
LADVKLEEFVLQRSIKLGFYGLVLAGLVGGTVAWADTGKSVDLRIDGRDQHVRTAAADVRGVLADAGVKVGEHDIIAPDLESPVKSGAEVVVRRGHLLHLSVNGKAKDVWVNADSVAEALSQLGYDSKNFVSVSRSKRLDAATVDLSINTPKRVTFTADGKSRSFVTAAPTVYEAIADAGIYLGPGDRMSATGTSALKNNQVIRIQRVSYGKSVEQVAVAFQTVEQQDSSAFVGSESVITPGQDGVSQVTYQLVYVDGKLVGKVAQRSVVTTRPVNEVKKVGSKPVPSYVSAVPAGSAQQIAAGMVAARGWGADEFSCLVSLWNKESGWRVDAANPSGAYGIPQALPGSKMASAGADWQTNPATQITWGLQYIAGVYGTPCAAWSHSQATNWY